MCNILGQLIFNFAIENLIFNGIGGDGVGVNFLFFPFSVVFAFCLCFCGLSFSFLFCFRLFPFPLFFVFLCLSLFFFLFSFLCFSLSLFVSKDCGVFCTFPGSCCRLSLSLRLRGNCKNPKRRKFRSDPVYTNPVRNFPSGAPFSRLRPNDPSSRLTNDTRGDPFTESHRPIATKTSPKTF